jgi:hypothetical protein
MGPSPEPDESSSLLYILFLEDPLHCVTFSAVLVRLQ